MTPGAPAQVQVVSATQVMRTVTLPSGESAERPFWAVEVRVTKPPGTDAVAVGREDTYLVGAGGERVAVLSNQPEYAASSGRSCTVAPPGAEFTTSLEFSPVPGSEQPKALHLALDAYQPHLTLFDWDGQGTTQQWPAQQTRDGITARVEGFSPDPAGRGTILRVTGSYFLPWLVGPTSEWYDLVMQTADGTWVQAIALQESQNMTPASDGGLQTAVSVTYRVRGTEAPQVTRLVLWVHGYQQLPASSSTLPLP
jgi:hypothetical protein